MDEQILAAVPAGQQKSLLEIWEASGHPAPLTLLNAIFSLIQRQQLQSVWTRSENGSLSVAYARA